MDKQQKQKMEVLWKIAKEDKSRLARKEIAAQTEKHKAATARGRLEAARRGRR